MKKRNKKAFTLIELMVTLAIFSVIAVLISAILMQGQRILSKVNNRTIIQDEIRTALLKIQSEAQNSSEAIVNNKFGKFSNNKWLLDSTDNTARELVRFIKEGEDTSKVYVEVNDGNKHQLIEFSINKTTNEIVENSTNILINEIDGSDAESISVNVEDINDSNGNKINDLVTINCSSIVKGEDINESDYLISFNSESEKEIIINIGTESEGDGTKKPENGDSEKNYSTNKLPNDPSIDLTIDEWQDSKTYLGGEVVKYNGVIYRAAFYSQGVNPEYGNAWTIISEEPTIWKITKEYNTNQKVIYNGQIYIAKWYVNVGLKPGENDCWELVN